MGTHVNIISIYIISLLNIKNVIDIKHLVSHILNLHRHLNELYPKYYMNNMMFVKCDRLVK